MTRIRGTDMLFTKPLPGLAFRVPGPGVAAVGTSATAGAMSKHRRMTVPYYTIAPAPMLREMTVTGICGASSKDSFPPVRARHSAILALGVSVGVPLYVCLLPKADISSRPSLHRGYGPVGPSQSNRF